MSNLDDAFLKAYAKRRVAPQAASTRNSQYVQSTQLNGPGEARLRIDDVAPSAPSKNQAEAKTDSQVASNAKPTVSRKPLSQYLSEMRTQMAELERRQGALPHDTDEITPEFIEGLVKDIKAPARQPASQPSAPAVYAYPESASNRAPSANLVDKVTLRKLANSSDTRIEIDQPKNRQPIEGKAGVRIQEPQINYHVETIRKTIDQVIATPAKQKSATKEKSPSMRDVWRDDEHSYRVDQRHEQTWDDEFSAASTAVVKSIADYNPNSESSQLYKQAKLSIAANKTRIEQQIASAAQAIAPPMHAEWEVDHLQWPLMVLDLLESQEAAFDEVANQLQAAQRKGLKTVAITSAERGVGKSTTCLSLAAVLAHKGLKVALVDADTESPALVNQLNLEVERGWQDCIRSNVPLESIAVHATEDGVTFFPLTDSIPTSEVKSLRTQINHLLRRIARSFDIVLVDMHRINYKQPEAIGTGDDAALDAVLVVVDAELSVKDRTQTTLQLLSDQKIQSIGIVENFSDFARSAAAAS
jgi:Mrp family chromosome partitioning ATPase